MNEDIQKKISDYFSQFKQQSYKKGEILVRAEDAPPGIFYLMEGAVKEYAISRSGEELVVNVFKPIAFFPMSWAINGTPNQFFFEAMTDVTLRRAPRDDVVTFIKHNPDILFDLLSRVFKGTDGLLTRMTYLMSGNAYGRLVAELLIYVKRFAKGQNKVNLTISEKDLAALTGMTRETVSREIRILKEKKYVSLVNHTIVINNVQLLEEEISGGV